MTKGFAGTLILSFVGVLYTAGFLVWGFKQGFETSVPDSLSVSGVVASFLYLGSVLLVIHLSVKKWRASLAIALGLLLWYATVLFLGQKGFFAERPLFAPNIIFAFILIVLGIKYLYQSSLLQKFFEAISPSWLIGVQLFRIMGVGFLTLYMMKLLPGEFAIPTGIGDIIIGLTAPIVAYIYTLKKSYSRPLAVLWNLAGITDLVTSIILGISTYPLPHPLPQQVINTDISNAPIALFPLVIIPVFAVPLSILLHLFSLRAMRVVKK